MAASSSAHHKQQQQNPTAMYASTAAPPPTPSSSQPNTYLATSAAATADALSRLLNRLPPPSLSLPTRPSGKSSPSTCPPTISLSDLNSRRDLLLSASSQLGFFQLTNHDLPPHLANSAESESVSLFELARDKKESFFPKNWPLGFDEDEDGNGESFWLDSACSSESSTELGLASLREWTRALEKLGLEVVEMMARALGFDNPFKEDPTRFCSLMVLHEGLGADNDEKHAGSGGFYPYVVGLQYQIRSQKYSLLADSGWVTVMPEVDSVLVTIGDISQVWSNGKLKKVRGRPVASLGGDNSSHCVSMSLLLTLPSDSIISPLLPVREEEEEEEKEEGNGNSLVKKEERRVFGSFSFENYAWMAYHERFKDTLDRYRMSS